MVIIDNMKYLNILFAKAYNFYSDDGCFTFLSTLCYICPIIALILMPFMGFLCDISSINQQDRGSFIIIQCMLIIIITTFYYTIRYKAILKKYPSKRKPSKCFMILTGFICAIWAFGGNALVAIYLTKKYGLSGILYKMLVE